MTTKKPLQVLNASAGSGKTYHLVREYLRLLVQEDADPNDFRHILAMTFTNKAALEMKERILQALDSIGNIKGNHPLGKDLANELGMSEIEIQVRCRRVLIAILHRYEDFHVMTIDKFNLRLIKSFGRDLDLPHDFEVTLDESELIERIVDLLLSQLGTDGNGSLNKLMIAYAKSNVDTEQQWNFRGNLIQFGKILTMERNQPLVSRLLQMDFSTENYFRLKKEIESINIEFSNLTKQLASLLNHEDLDAELLPGKSNTHKKIYEVASMELLQENLPLFSESFVSALDAELKPRQYFPENIRKVLREIHQFEEDHREHFSTVTLFLKNFFHMALLQYMADALMRIRNDEQLIRISEFNTLISELIQEESTPFIYERLGTRFKHFLLDEFQDTSRLQWLNMVPLVGESISQNHDNLIVGDPKQSIYRFKNGVAEQFVALPGVYNPEKIAHIEEQSRYFEQMGVVKALESNWRSAPLIVNFNNRLFKDFRALVPDEVATFYNSIEQQPQSKAPGRIFIQSREKKSNSDELLPQIITWINESLEAGHEAGDICILGNKNKECNRWAIGLSNAGFQVVSSESLLIRHNLKVQLTIAYLRKRTRPGNEQEIKKFAEIYFRVKGRTYNEYQKYFYSQINEAGKERHFFDEKKFLEHELKGADKFYFKHESIYNLIQGFYQLMEFSELNDPYLHHLADFAFDFGLHRGPDLVLFLKEYELRKNKLAVQTPEGPDAVKIMTIHKSKGLEFPVVIIPSMDFPSRIRSEFLVDLDDYIVYKQPTQSEQIGLLKDLYKTENEQIIADNLNKCYVAMTRAKFRLYVGNDHEKGAFGKLFHAALCLHPQVKQDSDSALVDLDEGFAQKESTESSDASNFLPKNVQDYLWFPHIALQDKNELYEEDYLSDEMQFGLEFHKLAASIHAENQIKPALEKGIAEGSISSLNEIRLASELHKLFENTEYTAMLQDAIRILSEQEIISDKGELQRPDKIILKESETILIDFKTGVPKSADEKQIRKYHNTLQEMGYSAVKACIFYSSLQEIRCIIEK